MPMVLSLCACESKEEKARREIQEANQAYAALYAFAVCCGLVRRCVLGAAGTVCGDVSGHLDVLSGGFAA